MKDELLNLKLKGINNAIGIIGLSVILFIYIGKDELTENIIKIILLCSIIFFMIKDKNNSNKINELEKNEKTN